MIALTNSKENIATDSQITLTKNFQKTVNLWLIFL